MVFIVDDMFHSKWKDALLKTSTSFESSIRFGLPYVPISHLAKQYFCEQQLDYEYKKGKEENESEILGIISHDIIFEGKKVSTEEIIELIDSNTFFRCSFPVYFQANGVLFYGEPDDIIFYNGKPVFLLELKTTSAPSVLYKNYTIQIEAYAFALEQMGFDCKELCNLLISMDQLTALVDGDEWAARIMVELHQRMTSEQQDKGTLVKELQSILSEDVVIHKIESDKTRFLNDVNDSTMYWKMERNARIMGSPGKCINCHFYDDCPHYEKSWSDEENKKLLEEYSKGTSIEEIVKLLGKSEKSVNHQLIRHKYPKHGKKWSARDIDKLKKLFLQEKAVWYIADVLKRKPSAVNRKLVHLGMIAEASYSSSLEDIRKTYPKYGTHWSEEDIEKLVSMFEDKKSIDQISVILQRTKYSILGKLHGLKIIGVQLNAVKQCDACGYREKCLHDLNKRIYPMSTTDIHSELHQDNVPQWDEEETNLLCSKFAEGESIAELSIFFHQSQQSIENKLISIGLIVCSLYKTNPEML